MGVVTSKPPAKESRASGDTSRPRLNWRIGCGRAQRGTESSPDGLGDRGSPQRSNLASADSIKSYR